MGTWRNSKLRDLLEFKQGFALLAAPLAILAVQTFTIFLQEGSFGRLRFEDAASTARWGVLIGIACLWVSLRNRRAAQNLGTRLILVGITTLSTAWLLLSLLRGSVVQ